MSVNARKEKSVDRVVREEHDKNQRQIQKVSVDVLQDQREAPLQSTAGAVAALGQGRPTSPARRFYSASDFKEITRGVRALKKLTEHGMNTDRPVAVISNGTRPDQRTIVGTLGNIEQRVADLGDVLATA